MKALKQIIFLALVFLLAAPAHSEEEACKDHDSVVYISFEDAKADSFVRTRQRITSTQIKYANNTGQLKINYGKNEHIIISGGYADLKAIQADIETGELSVTITIEEVERPSLMGEKPEILKQVTVTLGDYEKYLKCPSN